MDLAYVESLVRKHYGILAHAAPLSGVRGENFRLYGGGGTGHVLKVLPAGESPATADLLPAVLVHLERVAPELPVPRIVRSRDGQAQLKINDAGGVPRMVLLHTFSPGKLLVATTRSSAQRRACGELLARLGHALRTFDHAGSRREVAWDIAQMPRLAEVIPMVPELPSVDFLRAFVDLFTARIAPRLTRLRNQFIHSDFTARNIVVESRKASNVVGIIGFGAAVHTALVADVAAGAIGQLAAPENAQEEVREFVEAYCRVEPLLKEELALLDWLIAGRIVLETVLAAWQRMYRSPGGQSDGADATLFGWRIEFAKRLVSP
jgi:hydroxylysine kinase